MPRVLTPPLYHLPSRFLWLVEPGDIIVLDRLPEESFLQYLSKIKGIALSSFHIAILPEKNDQKRTHCPASLLDDDFIEHIKGLMVHSGNWEISAFLFDQTILGFAKKLNLGISPLFEKFVQDGFIEKLNDKVFFREMAGKLNIPHALGTACFSLSDLKNALKHFLEITGQVIVKRPDGAGGGGNVGISLKKFDFQGVYQSYLVENNIESIAAELWEHQRNYADQGLVVEVYYSNKGSVSVIFDIGAGDRPVSLLNTALITYTVAAEAGSSNPLNSHLLAKPQFSGVQMPITQIQPPVLMDLLACSYRVAYHVKEMGYHGLMSIDAVELADGSLVFTEINARMGGETHVNFLVNALSPKKGAPFQKSVVFLSLIKDFHLSFTELKERLENHGLLFFKDRGVIIITLEKCLESQKLEYLIIAPHENLLRQLQKQVLQCLAN